MSSYESHEDYMVRRIREENEQMAKNAPEKVDRVVDRILHKLEILEQRMKNVETDIAYQTHTPSPEEQKIKDYLNK